MTRIKRRFDELAAAKRAGLVCFLTAGDPTQAATLELMQALVRGGADVIELGVPFSDPMADGPIIQRASERALAQGTSLRKVLDIVASFREQDQETPVVLMGYLNPIERMGYDALARRAAQVGVDGLLVVDLPPEEAHELHEAASAHALDQVFLLAPNSSVARVEAVARYASGFVYYVSVKGVTGDKTFDIAEVTQKLAQFRARIPLPIGVGFGVKSAAAAAAVAAVCDAVIVGSALVEIVERGPNDMAAGARELQEFVAGLRTALNGAARAA